MFCNYSGFMQWLQDNLLPCPFKKLTGFDCPGCGFQRSVIALLQGDLSQSLHYYPATIPLLITAVYLIAEKYLRIAKKEYVRNALYIFTGTVIAGSYLIKLYGYTQATPRF